MEIRKDYILDRWVYLSENREKRPKEFKTDEVCKIASTCFFCPGNEKLTPAEIGRISKKDKWELRWFTNKFPAVTKEGNPAIKTDNDFFTYSSAFGTHEVIVESNDHKQQLWDLNTEHIKQLFLVYNERIIQLEKDKDTKYVLIFKNHGREAGTSLIHSHTQITSLNKIPKLVSDKVAACKKYEKCPYCKIIEIEKNSDRRCFENNTFVAFTPYASRYNYEILVFPKRHVKGLNDLTEEEFIDISDILIKILNRLKTFNMSYNFFIHYSPKGEDLHLQIEITPRIALWGGFEIGSDDIINSISPEYAAKFYRNEELL